MVVAVTNIPGDTATIIITGGMAAIIDGGIIIGGVTTTMWKASRIFVVRMFAEGQGATGLRSTLGLYAGSRVLR